MKRIFPILIIIILASSALPQGCMSGGSEEGAQIKGYIQPQFEFGMYDDPDTDDSENTSSFTFNRARLGVVGSIPYDVSYYFFMEFSDFQDGPYLLDAFVTYTRLDPWARISLGQFKAPYSMEFNTPCQALYTIKRSLGTNNLTNPARDIGLFIDGHYEDYVKYTFAVLNGAGKNEADVNMNKDIAGRVVVTPIEYVSLGSSFRMGKRPPAESGVEDEDEITRFGGEIELRYDDIKIQGEYLMGNDKGSYTTGGGCGGPVEVHTGDIERSGVMAMAMYTTPWNLQPVIKYESYDGGDAATHGVEQITTFGINYFINDWSRVQLNYLYKAEEIDEYPNDEVLLQFQAMW
ncbi:MAG: porin [Candidatus Zixiibacteriota bacterium]